MGSSSIVGAAHCLMLMDSSWTGFSKVLTPSDTRRDLSRFIIPSISAKRCMEKCTPMQRKDITAGPGCQLWVRDCDGNENSSTTIGLLLKQWSNSNKSFVFTTGWSDYVETKGLMQNDVLIFWWDSRSSMFCISSLKSPDNV